MTRPDFRLYVDECQTPSLATQEASAARFPCSLLRRVDEEVEESERVSSDPSAGAYGRRDEASVTEDTLRRVSLKKPKRPRL
ncbi:MAG: hypothetical protein JSR31_18230 [Nitrospira sp.]|nr:hypothetical protein [Nitrospira sp.]